MFGGWPISKGGYGVSVPTRSWPSLIRPRSPPPPPPPVVSSSPPQPTAAKVPRASAMTATSAQSRVLLIEIPPPPILRLGKRPRDHISLATQPSAGPHPPLLHFLKQSSSESGNAARRTPQQTLRRAVLRHRRVDRQHAAGRAAAPLAEGQRPHLRQARGDQSHRLGEGP